MRERKAKHRKAPSVRVALENSRGKDMEREGLEEPLPEVVAPGVAKYNGHGHMTKAGRRLEKRLRQMRNDLDANNSLSPPPPQ